jgi:hypothetical protein
MSFIGGIIGNLAAKGVKSLYNKMDGKSGHRQKILDIQIAFLNDNNNHSGFFRYVESDKYSTNIDDYANFFEHPLIIKEKLFAYIYVLCFSKKNNHGHQVFLENLENDILTQGSNYKSIFKVENSFENQQLLINFLKKIKELFEKSYSIFNNINTNFPIMDKILSIYETSENDDIKEKATLRMYFHISTFIATGEQTIGYDNEIKNYMGMNTDYLLGKIDEIIKRNEHSLKDNSKLVELAKIVHYEAYNSLNFESRDTKFIQLALILGKKMNFNDAEVLAHNYMTKIYSNKVKLFFNDYLISKEILAHLNADSFNLYRPFLVF